jgi:hypothetical protein
VSPVLVIVQMERAEGDWLQHWAHQTRYRIVLAERARSAPHRPITAHSVFGDILGLHLFSQASASVGRSACDPRHVGREQIDVAFAQREHRVAHRDLDQPDAHEYARRQ